MTQIVYTDGSYSRETNFGGWAWVTEDKHNTGGCTVGESSFAMEVRAVLEALRNLPGDLVIYSDNDTVVRLLNQHPTNLRLWITGKRRKRIKQPLVHVLLEHVIEEMRDRRVVLQHVKGHSGHPMNTKADKLAGKSMREVRDLP